MPVRFFALYANAIIRELRTVPPGAGMQRFCDGDLSTDELLLTFAWMFAKVPMSPLGAAAVVLNSSFGGVPWSIALLLLPPESLTF